MGNTHYEFRSAYAVNMNYEIYFNWLKYKKKRKEKLTDHYIALIGQNYPALSHDFRLGVTTVMMCIRETCAAIYKVLKTEYLRVCIIYFILRKPKNVKATPTRQRRLYFLKSRLLGRHTGMHRFDLNRRPMCGNQKKVKCRC